MVSRITIPANSKADVIIPGQGEMNLAVGNYAFMQDGPERESNRDKYIQNTRITFQ